MQMESIAEQIRNLENSYRRESQKVYQLNKQIGLSSQEMMKFMFEKSKLVKGQEDICELVGCDEKNVRFQCPVLHEKVIKYFGGFIEAPTPNKIQYIWGKHIVAWERNLDFQLPTLLEAPEEKCPIELGEILNSVVAHWKEESLKTIDDSHIEEAEKMSLPACLMPLAIAIYVYGEVQEKKQKNTHPATTPTVHNNLEPIPPVLIKQEPQLQQRQYDSDSDYVSVTDQSK